MSDKLQNSKNQRPEVFVSALTANTIEVVIDHDEGTVRLICEHGLISIDAKGTKIRIKP